MGNYILVIVICQNKSCDRVATRDHTISFFNIAAHTDTCQEISLARTVDSLYLISLEICFVLGKVLNILIV